MLAALASQVFAGTSFAKSKHQKPAYVEGEVIVKLKQGSIDSFMHSKLSHLMEANHRINVDYGDYLIVKLDQKMTLEQAIKELKKNPDVEYAEPNFIYTPVDSKLEVLETFQAIRSNYTQTNDPMFSKLWGLKNTGSNEPSPNNEQKQGVAGADIDAVKAWSKFGKGHASVKVAVIDTGVDYRHPDLKNNIMINEAEKNGRAGVDDDGNGFVDDIYGWDFAGKDNDPWDGNNHGTHCSGTIAAEHDNGKGVAGVVGNASILPVKFLSDGGSGTTEDAIAAIDYATKRDVDIMSNSWGGGGFSQALKDAIKAANERGILFVAAAGNHSGNNDTLPTYPANYEVNNVISVAAHNASDNLASFSCYGRNTVHIAAPGRNILSTTKNGGYKVFSGTSMATPHVSGALALLASRESLKSLGITEVKDRLVKTSVPIPSYRGKTIAGGRLNAYNLLADDRPYRNEPDPNAWQTMNLDRTFQSAHPYANNADFSKTVRVPGAKYIRVIVERFEIENGYDSLAIVDKKNHVVEDISGAGRNFASDYVEGDTVKMRFTSDSSVPKWGFVVKKIQYIK